MANDGKGQRHILLCVPIAFHTMLHAATLATIERDGICTSTKSEKAEIKVCKRKVKCPFPTF